MTAITLSRDYQTEIWADILRMAAHQILARHDDQQTRSVISLPTGRVEAVDWLSQVSSEADRVRQFCQANNIMTGAIAAAKIAERRFPVGCKISLMVEQDPESDGEWLTIDVMASADSEKLLECYDQFIREWSTTPNATARQLIRLTFCHA